jgi:hypothetical protein
MFGQDERVNDTIDAGKRQGLGNPALGTDDGISRFPMPTPSEMKQP